RAGIGKTAILAKDSATNQGFQSIVPHKNKLNTYFIYSRTNKLKRYAEKNGAGSTFTEISGKQMAKMPMLIPILEEQIKIGNFFKQLDKTVALHQQKLDKLEQLKKGFMEIMFTQKEEDMPRLRFANFNKEWEKRNLDSMVERVKSYPLSRNVETNEYTGYKYIHYGDIHTKVADKINKTSNLPNIMPGRYVTLKKGDLILADASEDYQGIAVPAVVTIKPKYNLVSGLHTITLRPKQADYMFLYYLFHSSQFRKFGYRVGTGMKVFGITVTNLLSFNSRVPMIKEQMKIGIFFKKIERTISYHQDRLDKLELLKKAFLQKMFI